MGQSYRQSPSQTHPAAVGNSGDRLEGSRVTERESKLFLSQPLWLSEANPQKPQRRGMTATTKELSRVPELPHQMLLRQKNNNTKSAADVSLLHCVNGGLSFLHSSCWLVWGELLDSYPRSTWVEPFKKM